MFGLFDPPNLSIKKRVPKSALISFDLAETFAAVELKDFERNRQNYMLGVIMAIWTHNNVKSSHIVINDFDYRFVKNMASNCDRGLASDERDRVKKVLERMMEAGLL